MSGKFSIRMRCHLPDGSTTEATVWTERHYPTIETEEWFVQEVTNITREICKEVRRQYEPPEE